MKFRIVRLSDCPEMKGAMAAWFSSKWGIPREAYDASMAECLIGTAPVPQWYAAMDGDKIVGGLGIIENDFHNRPDLSPNVCAVYTEPDYRCQGIAGAMLGRICDDMAAAGLHTLYLLTDHDSFYERYGWKYLCPVLGDGEEQMSRMYIHEQ